jgi:hypothetical protein
MTLVKGLAVFVAIAGFADDGWRPEGGTPEDLQKLWTKTSQQLGDVIRQRHITLQ